MALYVLVIWVKEEGGDSDQLTPKHAKTQSLASKKHGIVHSRQTRFESEREGRGREICLPEMDIIFGLAPYSGEVKRGAVDQLLCPGIAMVDATAWQCRHGKTGRVIRHSAPKWSSEREKRADKPSKGHRPAPSLCVTDFSPLSPAHPII